MVRLSGKARIDDRGRLVLPADLRHRLGLKPGDQVRISEESDGSLRVESRRAYPDRARGIPGPFIA